MVVFFGKVVYCCIIGSLGGGLEDVLLCMSLNESAQLNN